MFFNNFTAYFYIIISVLVVIADIKASVEIFKILDILKINILIKYIKNFLI
jgi:hypothetical protein